MNLQSSKKKKDIMKLKVIIHHCTSWSVFKKRANEIFTALSQSIADADFELVLNDEGKAKRGSFEIYIEKEDGERKQLWSGISKSPRKEKFPDVEKDLKQQVLKIIKQSIMQH